MKGRAAASAASAETEPEPEPEPPFFLVANRPATRAPMPIAAAVTVLLLEAMLRRQGEEERGERRLREEVEVVGEGEEVKS